MSETVTRSRRHAFPFDEYLADVHPSLTFLRLAVLVAVGGAVVDFVVFGLPETAVPYNYPYYVDVVLFVSSAVILRRSHAALDDVKRELMFLADQQLEGVSVSLDTDIAPDRIARETEALFDWSFHPVAVTAGGVAGGVLVLGVMAGLGVMESYPYLLMNFAFGAAHGLFIVPTVGAFLFGLNTSRRYIVDISLLDPDGMGGYRRIGDTLVRLSTYGIFVITVDFVILSSVAFTGAARFQQVVVGLYLLLLVALIGGTVFTTLNVRRQLLEIRDREVQQMQLEFYEIEEAYWRKHDEGVDNQTESLKLLTTTAMFDQIVRMSLWPINLYSLARLAASVGMSIGVFLVENLGLLNEPVLSGLLP